MAGFQPLVVQEIRMTNCDCRMDYGLEITKGADHRHDDSFGTAGIAFVVELVAIESWNTGKAWGGGISQSLYSLSSK